MPFDKDTAADLKAQISASRKRPLNFALSLGKKPISTAFVTDKVKAPAALMRQTKKEKGVEAAKSTCGIMQAQGKVIVLDCEVDPPSGIARKLRQFFLEAGLSLKIEVLAQGVTFEEDGDDEGAVEEQAREEGAQTGAPQPALQTPQQGQADPAQKSTIEAELKSMLPGAKAMMAALPDVADNMRGLVSEVTQALGVHDYDFARVRLTQLEGAIAQSERTLEALWETAQAGVRPDLDQVFARGLGNVDQIRKVWDFAVGRAEAGDFAGAIAAMDRLRPAIVAAMAANTSQAQEEIPAGTVSAAVQEREIAELRAALAQRAEPLKAAAVALPDRAGEVSTLVGAARESLASGSIDLARQNIADLDALIAEADRLKQLCATALARLKDRAAAAIASRKLGADDLKLKWNFAIERVKEGKFTPALTALEKAEEKLIEVEGAAEAEASGVVAQGRARIEALEAFRTQLDRMSDALAETAIFLPDQVGRISSIKTDVETAISTNDPGGARSGLMQLETLIERGRAQRGTLKAERLAEVAAIEDPKGISDAEKTDLDTKRAAVATALADPTPDGAAFTTAAAAKVTVEETVAAIMARVEARRKEVQKLFDDQKAELTRLLALRADTTVAQRLKRKLEYERDTFGRQMTALDYDAAETTANTLAASIVAMKAEETNMAAATTLRAEIDRALAAGQANVDAAFKIYEVTPAFEDDVEAFADAHDTVFTKINRREYKRVLPLIDALDRAARKLVGRRAEFDRAVAQAATSTTKLRDAKAAFARCKTIPDTTEDANTSYDKAKALKDACKQAHEDKDYPLAIAKADACIAEAAVLEQHRAACNAAELVRTQAIAVAGRVQTAAQMLGGKAVRTPELQAWVDTMNGYQGAGATAERKPDWTVALAEYTKMENHMAAFAALDAANDVVIARRKTALAARKKLTSKYLAARRKKVVTAEQGTARQAADAAIKAAKAACESGAADFQTQLDTSERLSDVVIAFPDPSTDDIAAGRKAFNDAYAAIKAAHLAAIATAKRLAPHLQALRDEINAEVASMNTAYKKQRFGESLTRVDRLAEIAAEVERQRPAAETAQADATRDAAAEIQRQRVAYETAYVNDATLIAQTREVLAYDTDLVPELEDDWNDLESADADRKRAASKTDWAKAQQAVDTMRPLVAKLFAQKARYDDQLRDATWVQDKLADNDVDIDHCNDINEVNREFARLKGDFDAALDAMMDHASNARFAAARAAWPAVDAAITAIRAKDAEYAAPQAEWLKAMNAWRAIDAKIKKADRMRPLTDEIKGLLAAYSQKRNQFWAELKGFDFAAAETVVGEIEAAADALIAKLDDGSYGAARTAARQKATAAETTIKAKSIDEWKGESNAAKLAVLDDLRGQHKELTDDQRKLQRVIYAAMELDDDFVKLDDARRAELTSAIRADTELMSARAGWSSLDPAERIRLLQKTLAKECELYGMPVPPIQPFEAVVPPGDEGSYDTSSGVVNLNVHPTSSFSDFHEAIDTIVHENAHNYQKNLIRKLEDGLVKPGDPEYVQALLFQANDPGDYYVDSDEDEENEDEDGLDIYEKQPQEEHAWRIGGKVSAALQSPPPAPPLP